MKNATKISEMEFERILNNARVMHENLEQKVRSLSLELQTSYEREKKLLRMISTRDDQSEELSAELKTLSIDRGRIARENSSLIKNRGIYARENAKLKSILLDRENSNLSSIAALESEIEHLGSKYNALKLKHEALSKSKLGSAQLKYWKWKSGK
ncbi:hypothetical protein [Glutamicibacter sp. Je.9.36]|uniref:hypothetical protein n=1 Tax=Glutamicibacter sp. Je.9.36 TaxID=3142837 RepID=UPI003DA9B528